ncbi:MAG: hypothetical protein NVSMB25_05300 [Thermoleophilaceae bacterium]
MTSGKWIAAVVLAAAAVPALLPGPRDPGTNPLRASAAIVLAAPAPTVSLNRLAARLVARRFLTLYAAACGRDLTPAERRSWRSAESAQVAGFLLAQPPEQRLRGGHLIALELSADDDGFDARSTLAFATGREHVRLALARSRDRRWQVRSFLPGVVR